MVSLVRSIGIAAAAVVGWAAFGQSVAAQQVEFVNQLVKDGAITQALADRVLAEKEARSACKKEICEAFADGATADGAISCDVTKTWLRQEVTRAVLGDRITWPYGHAQCKTSLNLDRKGLAALRANPTADYTLPPHKMSCVLENTDGGEAYTVSFSVAPTISFEGGKATKASMNWSDIEGSTLASTAIWSAIQADSLFGVIDSIAVEQVNAFIFGKCGDVGVEIASGN